MDLFDPTGGSQQNEAFEMAKRFENLEGLTCNILDNSKQNSVNLLSDLAKDLQERYGVIINKVVQKHRASAQASEDEINEATKGVDFVVVGVGD